MGEAIRCHSCETTKKGSILAPPPSSAASGNLNPTTPPPSHESRFSWPQTSYLGKQILQRAGVKERGCIWNFFFLVAIFLLLWRMSPYRLLIIIGPVPVGKIEPGTQQDCVSCGNEGLEVFESCVLVPPGLIRTRG